MFCERTISSLMTNLKDPKFHSRNDFSVENSLYLNLLTSRHDRHVGLFGQVIKLSLLGDKVRVREVIVQGVEQADVLGKPLGVIVPENYTKYSITFYN